MTLSRRARSVRLLLLLSIVLGAAAAGSVRAAVPPGVTPGVNVEGIAQYHLDNGLEVLLFPDASKPAVTVNVTYKVGSRHENYGETGMAHLLEHMLFKGTPTHGNLLQELGKRGMEFNGSTFFDRTNYFETFPASDENLDWALAMEADRMVNSLVARKDLDTEMTVVRNEFESGENNPRMVLWQRMQGTAYLWHNYGHPTIGARSDIENVSIERLQAFYRTYYQPDNAVLVVAGRFDPERTLAAIQRYFGRIPKPTRALPPLYTADPVQDGERQVTVRRVGGNRLVALMYHTMQGADPDGTAMDAFGDIMTVAPAGRLYKALVETRKASEVEAWFFSQHDPGTIVFWATLTEGTSIDEVQSIMSATLANVAKEPITQAELDRVKAKADKAFEDTINNPNRLGVALSEAIASGDWRLFFLQRDYWRKLTPGDVQRVALAWLKPTNLTVGHYIPDDRPDRAPVARAVDVHALVKDYQGEGAVAAGETFDPTPANLEARTERYTLPNGLKVALLPKKTRGQTVNVSLALHFGNEKTLFNRYPDGALTGAMLMRGTKRHSRQEIQDALDKLRARLNVGGSETGASASADARRDTLPDTLRLMAEVLREPSFPAAEFEQLRAARLTGLEQARSEPQAVASRALQRQRNPYPRGDPRYAPTLDEDVAAIKAESLERVQRFYSEFYGGAHGELSLVGDFDADAVKPLIAQLFGDWAEAGPYARVPHPFVPNRAEAIEILTPDKANAVALGALALEINDMSDDYPALLVLGFLLGESSDSRLLNRLRQKEGVSYSAGSYLQVNSFEAYSTLGVYAIFAPQNAERVRTGMRDELARVVREGFTDIEVDQAKKGLMQERRLARASDSGVAGTLTTQLYVGRTFKRSAEVDAAIEAMTTAKVNEVARRYLKPDAMTYVFAGDFKKP